MIVRSFVTLLALLSAAGGTALAMVSDSPQPAISYVSSYNGPASAYRISRAGKSIAVAPLALLEPGDRVSVLVRSDKLGTKMTMTLSVNGAMQSLDAGHPYCVGHPNGECGANVAQDTGPAGKVASALKNLFASVAPLFAAAQEDFYSSRVDQMTSRGPAPAPSMPLLHTSPLASASLNGGALTIPWLGGQGPFHVRVFQGSAQQPLAEQSNIARNEARFASGLMVGTYRVEVEDSTGAKATGDFAVVADSAIPQLSADEQEELQHLPMSLRVPLSAGMLAKKGTHHEWNLAAYQQLATVPDTYPNVQPLRYLLVEATD